MHAFGNEHVPWSHASPGKPYKASVADVDVIPASLRHTTGLDVATPKPAVSRTNAMRTGALVFVDEDPAALALAKTKKFEKHAVSIEPSNSHGFDARVSQSDTELFYEAVATESDIGNGAAHDGSQCGVDGVPAWCSRKARSGPPLRPLVKDAMGNKRRKRAKEMTEDELERFRAVNRKIGRRQREKIKGELDALDDRLRKLEEERAGLVVQVNAHKMLLEHLKGIVRETLLSTQYKCVQQMSVGNTNVRGSCGAAVMAWAHGDAAVDDPSLLLSF